MERRLVHLSSGELRETWDSGIKGQINMEKYMISVPTSDRAETSKSA